MSTQGGMTEQIMVLRLCASQTGVGRAARRKAVSAGAALPIPRLFAGRPMPSSSHQPLVRSSDVCLLKLGMQTRLASPHQKLETRSLGKETHSSLGWFAVPSARALRVEAQSGGAEASFKRSVFASYAHRPGLGHRNPGPEEDQRFPLNQSRGQLGHAASAAWPKLERQRSTTSPHRRTGLLSTNPVQARRQSRHVVSWLSARCSTVFRRTADVLWTQVRTAHRRLFPF